MGDSTAAAAPVKCQTCGFLAARDFGTRALVEVEAGFRATGYHPAGMLGAFASAAGLSEQRPLFEAVPVCFVQAFDLVAEAKAAKDSAVLPVIAAERACPRFVKWVQGHTPREHQDMMDRQEQREWQAEQKRSDRRFHLLMVLISIVSSALFTVLGWFMGSRK